MDGYLALLPNEASRHRQILDDVEAMLPAMTARAARHDQEGSFPTEDIAALHDAGILGAVFPAADGGLGLGTEEGGAATLSSLLRLLGRGNLAVGRLFEAHVNAIRLIARCGTRDQVRQAARQAEDGALFGLWVTDPDRDALRAMEDGSLHGGKAFCSGAGHVGRAVVTLLDPLGETRLANLPVREAVATPLPFQMQGMRAAVTGRVSFDGLRIEADDWIGQPGAYLAEPDFSAGAWRTCAVTCGGLEALLALAMAQLRQRGRSGDPHQCARMGRAWIAQETAMMWLDRAAAAAEQSAPGAAAADIVTEIGFARLAIESACMEVMQLVERSLGLAAFLQPSPIERIRRDLATYLRQPAADEVLGQAAAHIMQTRFG